MAASTAANVSEAASRPASTPGLAGHEAAVTWPVGDQAGGQVAEDAEVLGQGPGHDVADGA